MADDDNRVGAHPFGRRLLLAFLVVVAGVLSLILLANSAAATHFRGGTIYAHGDDAAKDPLTTRIHLIVYIRASHGLLPFETIVLAPGAMPGAPPILPAGQTLGTPVGDVGVQPGLVGCSQYPLGPLSPRTPGTPVCGNAGGPRYLEGGGCIFFGDGTCDKDWVFRQFYSDTVNDWAGYEAWQPGALVPGVPHTYADEGPWIYSYWNCCHLSLGPQQHYPLVPSLKLTGPVVPPCDLSQSSCDYHYNNPDANFQLEGQVTLPADQPFKRNMKPIIHCNRLAVCDISLEASYAPSGAPYAVRFATSTETGNRTWFQPGPCPKCGAPATTAWITNADPVPAWHWLAGAGANMSADPDHSYYSTAVQILGNGTDRSGLEWLVDLNEILLDSPDLPSPPPPAPTKPWPVVIFGYKQAAACGLSPVQFTDASSATGATIVAWHWDFGDNTDSSEEDPSHAFPPEGGTYKVKLTVTDSNGKTSSKARVIAVTGYNECPTEQQPHELRRGPSPPMDGQDPALTGLDLDGDGIPDGFDDCPRVSNPDQANLDDDASGDACDDDADGDSIMNLADNCTLHPNPQQSDLDRDAAGDACDSDRDDDEILDEKDNCPVARNWHQMDSDADGVGDACGSSTTLSEAAQPVRLKINRTPEAARLQSEAASATRPTGLALAAMLLMVAALVLVLRVRLRKTY